MPSKKSEEKAELYQLAAGHGHASAQYNLGLLYNKGQGVRKDYTRAAELFRQAADQGYAPAQEKLRILYR